MPTLVQNYPEFIINPICLDEVAQNFRTYAEQVAFYAELPNQICPNVHCNWHGIANPQARLLSGKPRMEVIAGSQFSDKLINLFVNGLYKLEKFTDIITFSLFAALYIESLDAEEQS